MNFQRSNIPYGIKIVAISIFFLVQSNFLFAQKKFSDSTQVYDYWSKRGVIEVIYAYMNDYVATVTDSTLPKVKKKDCKKEINGLKAYEKQFIDHLNDSEIDELTSKFNKLSDFLVSNNWSGVEKNLFKPLKSNYEAKKALDSDFFTTKLIGNEKNTVIPGYPNKMNNWNKTVSRIISDYNDDLKDLKTKGNKKEKTSNISNTPKPKATAKLTTTVSSEDGSNILISERHNWIFDLIICLLSFLIGMFITYFIIKLKIYQLLDDDKETYKNKVQQGLFSFLSMVRFLKKRKDYYKNTVTKLEQEIKKLEKKSVPANNTASKTSIDNTESEKLKTNPEVPDKSIDSDISKDTNEKSISYFSIPETDGRFVIEKGEQTNDGSKYYRIEYRNNSNEGNLFFISGNQDKRAINRLDSYLKPVCDIDNIINAENASKIEVLKNGKVIKKNGSWVIDPNHKVKIKLM